jgi:hypothetical protein
MTAATERTERLHALADAAEKEAGSAAREASEALADMLGWTPAELKAHFRKILAGPPAKPGDVARVAALFGLVVVPGPEDEGSGA